MSEDPTPYDVVRSKVLQLAIAPKSPQEKRAWYQSVDMAYRELSHTPAFHRVLEHWTETVLLNEEASEGMRALVIEIIRSMNTLNQRNVPQDALQEEEKHGW
jgi:predicted transposase YbfD/YdcC